MNPIPQRYANVRVDDIDADSESELKAPHVNSTLKKHRRGEKINACQIAKLDGKEI